MNKKKLIILATIVLIVISIFLVVYNNKKVFIGSKLKEVNKYVLNIEKMNGNDTHTLNLCKNDRLKVYFTTIKGYLKLSIKGSDNNIIYEGDGEQAQDFIINIEKDGIYTISVEARYAEGKIYIQKKQ